MKIKSYNDAAVFIATNPGATGKDIVEHLDTKEEDKERIAANWQRVIDELSTTRNGKQKS